MSHSFYRSHPEEFFRFYRNKMLFPKAQPNAAHKKLAELERAGKVRAVVTQNIDGLHQAAGSRTVLELHGSVLRNYCEKCHQFYGLDAILNSTGIPHCEKCGGTIKPDVVLYEEGLDEKTLNAAVRYIHEADVLIIGGTSLAVYPAAGLIDYFQGDKLVVINKSATPQRQPRRSPGSGSDWGSISLDPESVSDILFSADMISIFHISAPAVDTTHAPHCSQDRYHRPAGRR